MQSYTLFMALKLFNLLSLDNKNKKVINLYNVKKKKKKFPMANDRTRDMI